MSTTLKSKAVSAALVLAMLLLGSAFGYLTLGKQQIAADASVPTPTQQACAFCGDTVEGGGGNLPNQQVVVSGGGGIGGAH